MEDGGWSMLRTRSMESSKTTIASKYRTCHRYQRDLFSYDHTLVNASQYVPASYVPSLSSDQGYVVTEAPIPTRFAAFWNMVHEKRLSTIVVLTNLIDRGKRKADLYWPIEVGQTETHGSLTVSLESKGSIRKCDTDWYSLVVQGKQRVLLFHVRNWYDFGVPPSVASFTALLKVVQCYQGANPLLVHCSAGIGRSGVFCLLYSMYCARRFDDTQLMMSLLERMRDARYGMVQSESQWAFCVKALEYWRAQDESSTME